MKWEKFEEGYSVPVKSWCENCEDGAVKQAINLAKHPVVFDHVALMPDAHQGYGMPIGGVIACDNAVIPVGEGVSHRETQNREGLEESFRAPPLTGEEKTRLNAIENLTPGDFRTVREELFCLSEKQTNSERLDPGFPQLITTAAAYPLDFSKYRKLFRNTPLNASSLCVIIHIT